MQDKAGKEDKRFQGTESENFKNSICVRVWKLLDCFGDFRYAEMGKEAIIFFFFILKIKNSKPRFLLF